MKKILLFLSLFVLCACPAKNDNSSKSNQNQADDIVTEQINMSNYQKYIRTEIVNLGNAFQYNEKIVFSGALSFATYDVVVRYSGIDWETSNEGTWVLTLDIGGGGETKKIYGSVTINDISGTCTYRY